MVKAKLLKAMEETAPAGFLRFYQGALFDRLLHILILYFCALFQHDALVKCMERSRQQHLEGMIHGSYCVGQCCSVCCCRLQQGYC